MRGIGLSCLICIQTLESMSRWLASCGEQLLDVLKQEILLRNTKHQEYGVIVFFFGKKQIETVEHLFFECEALKTVREVAVKFYKDFELSIPSADVNSMRLLFTLGLSNSCETKTKARNIFRVTAEYCYTIWQARNDVLFRYKILSADTVDKISHVLKSKCDRLYADSINLPAEK